MAGTCGMRALLRLSFRLPVCVVGPRRRWEDNIKIDLQEVGGGCRKWMERAQDRDRWRALVNTEMNFRVP
jgi:hypothetical protein